MKVRILYKNGGLKQRWNILIKKMRLINQIEKNIY